MSGEDAGMRLVEHALREIRRAWTTLNDDIGSHLPSVIADANKEFRRLINHTYPMSLERLAWAPTRTERVWSFFPIACVQPSARPESLSQTLSSDRSL